MLDARPNIRDGGPPPPHRDAGLKLQFCDDKFSFSMSEARLGQPFNVRFTDADGWTNVEIFVTFNNQDASIKDPSDSFDGVNYSWLFTFVPAEPGWHILDFRSDIETSPMSRGTCEIEIDP